MITKRLWLLCPVMAGLLLQAHPVAGATTNENFELDRVRNSLNALRAFEPAPSMALRDLFYQPGESMASGSMPAQSKASAIVVVTDEHQMSIHQPPRLIGIVIKVKSKEAFFVEGERGYMVREGGVLTERYRIERIEPNSVRLRDIATGLSRTIDWAGDE